MKRLFFFFVMIASPGLFAQGEFLNKSNSIGGSGMRVSTPNAPSVFKPNSTTPPKSIIEKKPMQFSQENKFANPGDPVKSKLNKNEKEYNPEFVRRDQFFGQFTTKSDFVKICYRDFGEVDGDLVSIYTPDMMLLPYGMLDLECKFIKLNLLKGENKITLQALNQGRTGPNTGEMQIIDEQGNMITFNQWDLAEGFRASVIIYKD